MGSGSNPSESVPPEVVQFARNAILRHVPIPLLPELEGHPLFVEALEGHLLKLHSRKGLLLPNFHERVDTIAVFTDYGGESPNAKYLTYSFLFAAYDALLPIYHEIKRLREEHGLLDPHKEISFKDLHYGPLFRCLRSWLRMGDCIPGLLLTLVVDKAVDSLLHTNERRTYQEVAGILESEGYGARKPLIAEKTARIVHVIGYMCAVLSKQGHKVLWMTDDDAIVAKDDLLEGSGRLLGSVLDMYAPGRYALSRIARPFAKVNLDLNLNDMLSLPDLVAGSIEASFSKREYPEESKTLAGARTILSWLGHQGVGLKKWSFSFRPGPSQGLTTAAVAFGPNDPPEELQYIDIDL